MDYGDEEESKNLNFKPAELCADVRIDFTVLHLVVSQTINPRDLVIWPPPENEELALALSLPPQSVNGHQAPEFVIQIVLFNKHHN